MSYNTVCMGTDQGADVGRDDAADPSPEGPGPDPHVPDDGREELGREDVDNGEGSRDTKLADHRQHDGDHI